MIRVVSAIVECEGSILLGKKQKVKDHFLSECWHLPGGHIEEGESEEEAVRRELFEETGLHVEVKSLLCRTTYESTLPKHACFSVAWYECTAKTMQVHAGDDLAEARFVHKKDVEALCAPHAQALWPEQIREFFTS